MPFPQRVTPRRRWRSAIGSGLVVALPPLLVVACGSDPAAEPADTLTGVTAELVITRQRDLLDRGLINVMTDNGSGHDLILSHRRLVADHFSTVEDPGTTSLRAGRRVAIQLPYGRADDCTSDSPVTAAFSFSYSADGGAPVDGTVDVGGTEILDGIRAEQCTAAAFEAMTDAALTDPTITPEGTLVATLRIEPASGSAGDLSTITVERADGTILVAVKTAAGVVPVTLPADGMEIPVTFVVNRCDPHALAEVTKRYGLDLTVSIDGGLPQPVAIDVSDLTDQLETIVQRCRDAGG
jgi:hypothetical protein